MLYAQNGFVPGKTIPVAELDNLVQGRLYISEYQGVRGSPYLLPEYLSGNIGYLEHQYEGLPLRYDTAADELVFLHRSNEGIQKIQLTKKFIRYFTIGDRYFINLAYSPYRDTGLRDGYYEVVFAGMVNLLARRTCIIEQQDSRSYFTPKTMWFLAKDGQVHRIRNRKSLFSAFDESYKKSITAFMRKQSIRLRKADDQQWLQLAAHLNTLLQSN